jgi:hypothetical protein
MAEAFSAPSDAVARARNSPRSLAESTPSPTDVVIRAGDLFRALFEAVELPADVVTPPPTRYPIFIPTFPEAPPSRLLPITSLQIDQAAVEAMIAKSGEGVFTTVGAVQGSSGRPLTFWQHEGLFFRAAAAVGQPVSVGALYLGVLSGLVRVRFVAPEGGSQPSGRRPVLYLALPDLLPGTVTPLATALRALPP